MQQDDFLICDDLDQVEESTGFELLPKADYLFRSIDTKLTETKDGSGLIIDVEFEICDGDYEGRRIFQKFNIKNKTAKAVQISVGQIKSWIKACGFEATGQLAYSQVVALEGEVFAGHVGIEKGNNGYGDKNKITAFKSAAGYAPPAKETAQVFQKSQPIQQKQQATPAANGMKPLPAFLQKK